MGDPFGGGDPGGPGGGGGPVGGGPGGGGGSPGGPTPAVFPSVGFPLSPASVVKSFGDTGVSALIAIAPMIIGFLVLQALVERVERVATSAFGSVKPKPKFHGRFYVNPRAPRDRTFTRRAVRAAWLKTYKWRRSNGDSRAAAVRRALRASGRIAWRRSRS